MVASARYFPVRDGPLRMEARLHRFGTDFGNGEVDRHFFQIDDEWPRYRSGKACAPESRYGVFARDDRERLGHEAVLGWMRETLAKEHPDLALAAAGSELTAGYRAVAHTVPEDFAVMQRLRADSAEAAIAVFVAFPSGWRPERILGADFGEIHGPVPGFADVPAQARAMTTTMVERGPYVRFVWTISADDHLDHHPEEGCRETWTSTSRGWLRVERQVTVPFPQVDTALFLIRVYLYAFDELAPTERATLARALEVMPRELARYKGLDDRVRSLAMERLATG